jgi:hypothetical protein
MSTSASLTETRSHGLPLHVKVLIGFVLGAALGLAVHFYTPDTPLVNGLITYDPTDNLSFWVNADYDWINAPGYPHAWGVAAAGHCARRSPENPPTSSTSVAIWCRRGVPWTSTVGGSRSDRRRRFDSRPWRTRTRREPETGMFDREYHEVACMIEGDVEIETDDGRLLRAGAGDVIVTPEGSSGLWRALTPVRKFWAVHHE